MLLLPEVNKKDAAGIVWAKVPDWTYMVLAKHRLKFNIPLM